MAKVGLPVGLLAKEGKKKVSASELVSTTYAPASPSGSWFAAWTILAAAQCMDVGKDGAS